MVFPTGFQGTNALLQAGPNIPIKVVISTLINEFSQINVPTVLILDDYQHISNSAVHAGLNDLIRYLPDNVHLVVAGRTVSPLKIANLKAYGQVHEINAKQLRFTLDETSCFLNDMNNLDFSNLETRKLHDLTEGWVTGLQLASLSLRRLRDRLALILSFSGRVDSIKNYLAEDVLRKLPEKIVDFLLKTSILHRLHPDLCNAVVGIKNSAELLNYLKVNNIFIFEVREAESWYRYHQLFADYLETQLRQMMPESLKTLHLTACDWFASKGFPVEAVKHALAAEDPERAARLIETCATAIGREGQFHLLYSWAQKLPKAYRDRCRKFKLVLIWAFSLSGQWMEAEAELESLERTLSSAEDDEERAIVAEMNVIRVANAVIREDYIKAERMATQWIESSAETNPSLMPDICNCLALAYLHLGNFVQARDVLVRAMEYQESHYTFSATVYRKCISAMVDSVEGHLQEAARKYKELIQFTQKTVSGPSIVVNMPAAMFYSILYEWNEVAAATQLMDSSLDILDIGCYPDVVTDYYIPFSFMLFRKEGPDAAMALLDRLEEYAHRKESCRLVAAIENQKVRLLLSQSKYHLAARYVANNREGRRRREMDYPGDPILTNALEKNTDARLLIASGRPAAAVGILNPLLDETETLGFARRAVVIRCLLGLAHYKNGAREDAVAVMSGAIRTAAREKMVRSFLDEGPQLRDLLNLCRDTQYMAHLPRADRQGVRAYVDEIVSTFAAEEVDKETDLKKEGGQGDPARPLVADALSDRESEILQILAQGLPNKEIAGALSLSIDTVKWHLKNLYAKLGVSNRTEAINEARILGIID